MRIIPFIINQQLDMTAKRPPQTQIDEKTLEDKNITITNTNIEDNDKKSEDLNNRMYIKNNSVSM